MSREDRTIRVAFDEVEWDRLCWAARLYGCTVTALVQEAASHVVDQTAVAVETP